MKVYETKSIRNLALVGHAGTGKTSFGEAILFNTSAINRRGTVEDRNTVSDYHEIEQEKGSSVFGTPLFAEYNDYKFNLLDTPGYDDYAGEMYASIHVADTSLIFVNAQSGIEVGTELAWQYSLKQSKPVMFYVNKCDLEQAKFDGVAEDLRAQFGVGAAVFQYPANQGVGFDSIIDLFSMKMYKSAGENQPEVLDIPAGEMDKASKLRNQLVEAIAESDEELMTKYFEEGDLSEEDMKKGLKAAFISRSIFPILCGSGKNNVGISRLFDYFIKVVPAPDEVPAVTEEGSVPVVCNSGKPCSIFVYKIFSDARLGDMTYFKVNSGKLVPGMDLVNEQRSSNERFGQLFIIQGKKREEVPQLLAGDIGATVKLKNTHINNTLHDKNFNAILKTIDYPNPKVRTAIVPKTKGEEEKVGMALNNLHLEDPTIVIEHSQELRQTIVHAQGELHLGLAKWRLYNRYKVEAEFIEPRVAYRETIQKAAKGSYRHKKQSGGAGQFAEVHMLIEPWYEGMPDPENITIKNRDSINLDWGGRLEYYNCIVGGVIDARFMPAILKGIMEKMQFGPLTGSYVRDIRVCIYDGKMHPVDSNEAAFKTASMMAFKDTFVQASPKILEPIYNIEVKVPEEFVGDVMSDLPSRRGLILGIESEGRYQKIKARMPLAEVDKYATGLRSMTQARATYTSEFAEYQAVPPNIQQDLIDAYKKQQAEEE